MVAIGNAVIASTFLSVRWNAALLVVALPLTLATAFPLRFRDAHRFRASCWAIAAGLVALQLPLVFFGVGVFLPGALLLVLAPMAWVGRVPVAGKAVTVVLLAVLVVSGWTYATYGQFVQERDTYVVHVTEMPDKTILMGDGSGIGYGADNVSYSSDRIWVGFPHQLSKTDREALERRLLELMPGAEVVRCHGQVC
jgi:hypothetical protein